MAGGEPCPVLVRGYVPSDRPQIEAFKCRRPYESYTRKPQQLIRRAAGLIECGNLDAEIFVADDVGRLVGVIVIGPDPTRTDADYVYAMGVLVERQCEGIGTRLKEAAMASTVVAQPRRIVGSTVHRRNELMIAVNNKLRVTSFDDPDHRSYLLTTVLVEGSDKDAPTRSRGGTE